MKDKEKKPYVSPRLRVIELETREVMAQVCKAVGGDMNFGLPLCGIANPCADLGS